MAERPSGSIGALRGEGGGKIPARDAFTIVEMLLAVGILSIIVGLMLTMVSQTSKTWKDTNAKMEQFRGARDAFDSMTRHISAATLNTYFDYVDSQGRPRTSTNATSFIPATFARQSDLRFLSGPMNVSPLNAVQPPGMADTFIPFMGIFFQAPVGFSTNTANAPLQNLLNTWGYFIQYGDDANEKQFRERFNVKGKPRVRGRLMELMEPTENLGVYSSTGGTDWINITTNTHVLAENIIGLVIFPKLALSDMTNGYTPASLAPFYTYESYGQNASNAVSGSTPPLYTLNQLPPCVQVTMIAVDEVSAVRFPKQIEQIVKGADSLFKNSAYYDLDIQKIQDQLIRSKINYRVFSTDVMIGGAKWSSSSTK